MENEKFNVVVFPKQTSAIEKRVKSG